MILVSVRCPLRPGGAWSPTPTGWCAGDWLHDLMCCGCMAIGCTCIGVDDASKREASMEPHAYRKLVWIAVLV